MDILSKNRSFCFWKFWICIKYEFKSCRRIVNAQIVSPDAEDEIGWNFSVPGSYSAQSAKRSHAWRHGEVVEHLLSVRSGWLLDCWRKDDSRTYDTCSLCNQDSESTSHLQMKMELAWLAASLNKHKLGMGFTTFSNNSCKKRSEHCNSCDC